MIKKIIYPINIEIISVHIATLIKKIYMLLVIMNMEIVKLLILEKYFIIKMI